IEEKDSQYCEDLRADDPARKSDAHNDARKERIAIIGIGCRFPGGSDGPLAFWRMLDQGTDAITEVPRERWDAAALFDPEPGTPGRICSRRGGFVDLTTFDAKFFGMSKREAASLDPQHRLLLETTWEAVEDAGKAPEKLTGSDTGVWIGMHFSES